MRLLSTSLLSLSLSLSASARLASAGWTSSGPFGGPAGFVSIDVQQPDRLIASSRNGGLFLSINAGRNWTRLPFPRLPGAFLEAVKIHPLDPQLILVAVSDETGEHAGLYESADGGQHWVRAPEMRGEAVFSLALFTKDPNRIGAGTRRGVFVSPDRGRSWRLAHRKGQPGPAPVMSLAFDPEDSRIIYAGTTHLPWKTTDGGQTWRSIAQGMLDDSDVFSIHVDSKHPEKIHASACSGIYLSDSRGEKWRRVQGIPGSDRRTHVVTEDPFYSSLLFAGTTAGLWKSADAGNTWRKLNDYIVRSVEFHPRDGRIVYLATQDRGMLKSTTAALYFDEINHGFTGVPVVKVLTPAGRPAVVVAMGPNGSHQLWRQEGSSWRLDRSTPRFREAAAHAGRLYLADETQIYQETFRPGGTSVWEPLLDKTAPIEALSGGASLAVIYHHAILRSPDAAKLRRAAPREADRLPDQSAVLELVAGGPWEIVRQASGMWHRMTGQRWSRLVDPPGRLFEVAASDLGIWAATTEGLFRSRDGQNWFRVSKGLPEGYFNTIVQHGTRPEVWFTSQAGQVFRSADSGQSWRPVGALLAGGRIDRLAVREDGQVQEIFALVEGQGVYSEKTLP